MVYVAGHVHLPDDVEVDPLATPPDRRRALTDPRKGEDLRSVVKKLERMRARGWVTVSRETFWTITDEGLSALRTPAAKAQVEAMHARERARQARWERESTEERRRLSEETDSREED